MKHVLEDYTNLLNFLILTQHLPSIMGMPDRPSCQKQQQNLYPFSKLLAAVYGAIKTWFLTKNPTVSSTNSHVHCQQLTS